MDPDQSSPTRLFATLSGALLVIGGTVGFFASSSFGTPGDVEDSLGAFAVNGWLNTLHIVLGALGLLAAGFAARSYSLVAGLLLGALAIWGFALGDGDAILDRLPADGADNLLHAVLAALGLAAAWADRKPRRRRKKREKAKRDRPKREDERARKREDERRARRERKDEEKDEKEGDEARSASADRSRRSEAGRDRASRDDEPPEPPVRRSRRRRRPPRPRA